MKKLYLLLVLCIVFAIQSYGQQAFKAYLNESGQVMTKAVDADYSLNKASRLEQMPGFPKKMEASPSFKNFRGVTLADIDQDGQDEILAASFNRLNVYKGDGSLLWQKSLTGTAIYPPAVADMDGNGSIGIVCVTGGVPNNGRVYYLDAVGNDISGWPLSFESHWIICGPVIADMNGDGQSEIIVQTRTSNNLHVLNQDGSSFGANWPQTLDGTPAVTPSVADINNDGVMDIVTAISDGTMYAFDANGNALNGFPVASDAYSFSYQSPLLVDFDGDENLSIVGSTHGDAPKFYARESDGSYRAGWPVAVPENYWTYSPPTVVDLNGDGNYSIFMSRPTGEDVAPMLYGFNPDGSMMDNFPITKSGGLEGFISVADINADGEHELIFGSNLMIEGMGFIHAYKMDGSGELQGFPLRPTGFTFMNGANLGDIDGDGLVDLVALSYEQNFSPTDSVFINAYSLDVDIETANILAGTYKGSNDHSGHIAMPEAYASILIDPEEITQSWSGNEIYCSDLTISNTGEADLEFNIATNYLRDNWITINPENASVPPGENILVEVCLDATELENGLYQAELIINSNDPINPEVIVPVNLSVTVGTKEISTEKLVVYPNPSQGVVQLKMREHASKLNLYNLQGQLLDEINLEEKTAMQLDLKPYQQNALMLEVSYQNGAIVRQLIVIN
ncbi:MAG: FG-GAP-like repeat-containing protein [Bacteroidales bacterium]|jgi:hypothetical protein|nr:FG-GAP-like repeat-containing protein [Bacteroidales bacterium]